MHEMRKENEHGFPSPRRSTVDNGKEEDKEELPATEDNDRFTHALGSPVGLAERSRKAKGDEERGEHGYGDEDEDGEVEEEEHDVEEGDAIAHAAELPNATASTEKREEEDVPDSADEGDGETTATPNVAEEDANNTINVQKTACVEAPQTLTTRHSPAVTAMEAPIDNNEMSSPDTIVVKMKPKTSLGKRTNLRLRRRGSFPESGKASSPKRPTATKKTRGANKAKTASEDIAADESKEPVHATDTTLPLPESNTAPSTKKRKTLAETH